jgi:membrane-associated phospholipid phosphatase
MGDASVDFIVWIQANLPWLVPVAHAFTLLGDEDFYVVVFPLLYWSVSPRVGVRLGVMLLLSAGLNSALKLATVTPRPFWVSDAVEPHVIETSFGVPSGHAQNAVAVWGTLAHSIGRSWAWACAAALAVLVGTSRWAVGVHAVEDTIAGWAVGALLLTGFIWAEPRVRGWLAQRSFAEWIAASFLAPLVLVVVAVGARVARIGWELPEVWAANFAAAAPGEDPLDPLTVAGVFTPAGALGGLGVGLAVLVRTVGGFEASPVLLRDLYTLHGQLLDRGLMLPEGFKRTRVNLVVDLPFIHKELVIRRPPGKLAGHHAKGHVLR